jgi:adenylate cyclase
MLPPGIFTDKIVLVGRSIQVASELQSLSPDTFLTPFSLMAGGPTTSGVEIQATLVYDLLRGGFIVEPGAPYVWLCSW